MRRKEKEIKKQTDIEQILKESDVCRLAMIDGQTPYIVPMNFGYKNQTLYFHSAKQGKKIDLIQQNPHVCFEVDQLIKFKKASLACDWGVSYKSVIGWGKARFIKDVEEKIEALNIIMSQYSGRKFSYSNDVLEKTLVIKVLVDKMTGKQS